MWSVAQLYLTLCSPMDCGLSDSSVHWISQEEHWNGVPFPPPEHLADPGIEFESPESPALANGFLPLKK